MQYVGWPRIVFVHVGKKKKCNNIQIYKFTPVSAKDPTVFRRTNIQNRRNTSLVSYDMYGTICTSGTAKRGTRLKISEKSTQHKRAGTNQLMCNDDTTALLQLSQNRPTKKGYSRVRQINDQVKTTYRILL